MSSPAPGDDVRRPPPSLDEWDAMNADIEWPDLTPLNDQELAELRVRLNAPGGSRLTLTARESAARWKMGIIRPPEAVVNLYDRVQRERDLARTRPSSQKMAAGITDTIDFATGRTQHAPITGHPAEQQPPAVNELTRVQVLAQDIAEGHHADPSGRGRDYAVGVEHTIMWLLASTEQRPW
jgi:hypothetical protein